MMNEQEIFDALQEKLKQNMEDYKTILLQCSPEELIGRAAEIHAADSIYEELCTGDYSMEQYEYLLRFENPLELARDHWQSYQELSFYDEVSQVLSDMMEQDNESYYALDPEYTQTSEAEGMSLS